MKFKVTHTALILSLLVFNSTIAYSQRLKAKSIIIDNGTGEIYNLLQNSILKRGENDTIYCNFVNIPVYKVVLHKGIIINLELLQKLKVRHEYNINGKLTAIIINDIIHPFGINGSIIFNFYPKTGRVKSCTSSLLNNLYGANFGYSSKGEMEYVFNYNLGKKSGFCWEAMKHNLYRYDYYVEDQEIETWGVFNKKHYILAYFSRTSMKDYRLR